MSSLKKANSFLLRFKEKDSINGITSETFENLIDATGMTKTELVHFALISMVDKFIPAYEKDDGPLTEAQLQLLRDIAQTQQEMDESFEMI